jgi:16S rRNA processing protein RimM
MLVTIGKVLKPWGVKGELKIESLTDFPERFRSLTRVFLTSPRGKQLSCPVAGAQVRNGVPYLRFEGYDVPEKARELAGMLVQVPEEETVPLPEGSYYWYELIGMEVVSETGEALGVITDIFRTGSNDVYVVKRGRKEFSLPATREVIRQVDRKAKRMVIHVIEGLLD